MAFLAPETKAPNFTLPDQEGKKHSLKDYKGQWVVLYFYPKDDTPGCTIEGLEFTNLKKEFEKNNTKVFGISPDNTKSHEQFYKKHDLNITLLSDPDKKIMQQYRAYGNKILYGNTVLGVKRSTYIISPQGKIKKVWKAVRAKGHAKKVLETIQELQ